MIYLHVGRLTHSWEICAAASITATAAVLGLCRKTIQDLNIDREKLPNSHS